MRRFLFVLALAVLSPVQAARAHPGSGIVVDRNGNVFFVMGGSSVLRKLEPNGRVTIFAEDERLRLPHHLVLGRDGSLYVASDYDGRVWRVGSDGSLAEYFNTNRIAAPSSVNIGSWGDPFTIDSAGNIYALASPGAATIVRIGRDARVTPIAGRAIFGALHFSTMAWGPDGALYLTDESRVWRIVGDSASAIVPRGIQLLQAAGITIDGAGNIYVADYAERRVIRLAPDGAVNTPDAVARLRLRHPTGVTLSVNGDVYVLDNPVRGVAVWRVRGDRTERLYHRVDWQVYFAGTLLSLIALLLALQTWVRKPSGTIDWLAWMLLAGVAIIGLYWFAGAVAVFSWLRHPILALYLVAGWKSYRQLTRAQGSGGALAGE